MIGIHESKPSKNEKEREPAIIPFMSHKIQSRETRLRSSIVLDMQRYFSELPFDILELDSMLSKWARKLSVDFAAHIPPKMACMIGCFWNLYGQMESSKLAVFKMLNDLIIKQWLVDMLEIVCVSTGQIYQVSIEERYW